LKSKAHERNLKAKGSQHYKETFAKWEKDVREFDHRKLKEANTENVVNPISDEGEDIPEPTSENAGETNTPEEPAKTQEPSNTEEPGNTKEPDNTEPSKTGTEEPETPEEPEIDSTGFQYKPNSGTKVALWPALCNTRYHGVHWGKSDGENSYFTRGSKSFLCPEDGKRDDLGAVEFKEEENKSPCPGMINKDSRGISWAPVLVRTTFGEVPGKVRSFDDSGKTRLKGVFAYMGKSYSGPIMAWLC